MMNQKHGLAMGRIRGYGRDRPLTRGCTKGNNALISLICVNVDADGVRGKNQSRLKLPSPIICQRTPSA